MEKKGIYLQGIDVDELASKVAEKVRASISEHQPVETNEKKLMTPKQVAEFFGVARSTVYNWAKTGKLNPLGKGRKVFYDRAEVEASLQPLNLTK